MDTELTGPVEIWGQAQFPTEGLWNVHGPFKTYGRYANGEVMTISGDFENGIKWIGEKGWIFVCRDGMTTPTSNGAPATPIVPLRASDPKIVDSVIGPSEWHAYTSDDQHGNWLDCIHSRRAPVATAEIGHRACSTCLLHWIAMKTQHRVLWDPNTETIQGDDIAASLLARHQRHRYEIV